MTHGLTFLPQCDLIVVIDEGRIREMGTYSELVNNKGAFSELIETYANVEEDTKSPGLYGGVVCTYANTYYPSQLLNNSPTHTSFF